MKKGLPAPNGAFRDWEVNFMSLCVLNSLAWALNAAAITALQALQAPWAAAWAIVSTGTCTSAQRIDMREAKAAYISALRLFIKTDILYNSLISEGQIEQLGLKRRSAHGTPVPVPTTVPVITIVPVFVHKMKLVVRQQPDANGVSRRGKPDGVKFIQFAYNVDEMPTGPEDCKGSSMVSRTQQVIEFDESQAGKKVYVYGRFVNERCEGGDWTSRLEFFIP